MITLEFHPIDKARTANFLDSLMNVWKSLCVQLIIS